MDVRKKREYSDDDIPRVSNKRSCHDIPVTTPVKKGGPPKIKIKQLSPEENSFDEQSFSFDSPCNKNEKGIPDTEEEDDEEESSIEDGNTSADKDKDLNDRFEIAIGRFDYLEKQFNEANSRAKKSLIKLMR